MPRPATDPSVMPDHGQPGNRCQGKLILSPSFSPISHETHLCRAMLRDGTLTAEALRLWLIIEQRAWACRGRPIASATWLAHDMHASTRTTSRYVRELREHGLLLSEDNPGMPTRWILVHPSAVYDDPDMALPQYADARPTRPADRDEEE